MKSLYTFSIHFLLLFLSLTIPALFAQSSEPEETGISNSNQTDGSPFITTWKTDSEGDSEDQSIRIPMIGNGYDFNVDWGDGNDEDYNTNPGDDVEHSLSHTYSETGTYFVSITGNFPRIYINNEVSIREKIIDVTQWGDIEWASMERAFFGARNLDISAEDAPDLIGVTSMRQMFRLATNLNSNIGHWNTETITDMNGLFWNAEIFNQDIGSWNTGMVTDMMNMFDRAETFNQDISEWNTGNVENLQAMFTSAKAFNQDLNDWITGNVTDMSRMFNNAEAFNGDISGWNTANVETMRNMFGTARAFNQDISEWVTDNVTDMAFMFFNTDVFNADIGGWNTSKVERMNSMFGNSKSFNRDLSNWDVSGVVRMSGMFQNAESYDHSLGNWEIGSLDPTEFLGGMTEMLDNSGLSTENYDATLAGWAAFVGDNGGPEDIDLGAVGLTYCSGADSRQFLIDEYNWTFTGDAISATCGEFRPFITTWEVEAVDLGITIPTTGSGYNYDVDWGDGKNDTGQTGDASHTYDEPGTYTVTITGDLPRIFFNLDTSNNNREKIQSVEQWGDIEWSSMNKAFAGTSNLQVNASDAPDLSGVTDLSFMFQNASKVNADFVHWDVSPIELMRQTFEAATSFNGNIDNWETGNVTNMTGMFARAASFNRDISGWDVSIVEDMSLMFNSNGTFNRDISGWDTGNVANMSGMFFTAQSFDHSLGGLDISGVTDLTDILSRSGLSTENYDRTLIGWSTQSVQSNVDLDAKGLTYCTGEGAEARQKLINENNWVITDDGESTDCIPTNLDVDDNLPVAFTLNQNYPNPFNPSTLITFDLPAAGQVQLVIYDLMGRTVQTLVNGNLPAGSHDVTFDASRLSSGVYLYRLNAPGFTSTRKMMLVK